MASGCLFYGHPDFFADWLPGIKECEKCYFLDDCQIFIEAVSLFAIGKLMCNSHIKTNNHEEYFISEPGPESGSGELGGKCLDNGVDMDRLCIGRL